MFAVVISDREAVDLFLYIGNQCKDTPFRLNFNFPAVARNRAGAVFVVFHHTEQRHLQPVRLEHRHHSVHLPDTAVEQNQIGEPAETLAAVFAFFIFCKAPFEHFVHGAVIIIAGKRLNFKAFVGAFQRFAVLEHNHTGDTVLPGGMGNIVRFNIIRRAFKSQ